jgi:hypothetical protein
MSLDDRNAELERKLEANPIDDQIAALFRADGRRKFEVRILAVSLLLDVFLTIGFGYVTIQTRELAAQAESNKVALVRNCETANDSRRNNLILWDYLLALPTPPGSTLEQQKTRDGFKAFVEKTFAPRNCQAEISEK